MIIVGIDISTKTGVVALRCNKFGDEVEVLGKHVVKVDEDIKGIDRAIRLGQLVSEQVLEYNPDFCYIENYAFGNRFTLALLTEIGTMVRYFLHTADIKHANVAPTTVKKFATGKGKRTKKEMRTIVRKTWNFDDKSDDIVDAFCLAMYGLANHSMIKLTPDQIQAIV